LYNNKTVKFVDKVLEFEINLDESKENLLSRISNIVQNERKNLNKEKSLKFLVKKNGKKLKEFIYTLREENIKEYEKEYVLPKVVSAVIKKELGNKIAEREDIVNNIVDNLKNDPYWSNIVVDLIKSLNKEK